MSSQGSEHSAYEAAASLARAAHNSIDMHAAIAAGSADEAAFSLVLKGVAYTVIVRPLRYHENPEHLHAWGPWQVDPAGVVRECLCGAIDYGPEG